MRPAQVHEDQVGQASRRDGAQTIPQPDGHGAALCRYAQGFRQVHVLRGTRRFLLRHRHQPHALPHIQRVIAHGPVGTQPHCDAGLPHRRDRGQAHRELKVGLWTMRHAGRAIGQQRDVVLGCPDGMGQQ